MVWEEQKIQKRIDFLKKKIDENIDCSDRLEVMIEQLEMILSDDNDFDKEI